MNPVPIIGDNTAVMALNVPDGYFAESIEDNTVIFTNGEDSRPYKIPIGDGAPCVIKDVKTFDNCGNPLEFSFIEMAESGDYIAQVSIEGGGNYWWAVIKAIRPHKCSI